MCEADVCHLLARIRDKISLPGGSTIISVQLTDQSETVLGGSAHKMSTD